MEKILLSKVKAVLSTCTPENADKIKSKLMVILKPSEADEVYEYFTRIEPDFIKETYKVETYQIIPQYRDYFTDNTSINDIFVDEYRDLD